MSRRIRVKLLDGRSCYLNVDPHISVPELKVVLEKEVNIAKENSRIISKAQVFQDDKKLSDYVTTDEETIHVINRPAPPPPPPQPQPTAAGQPQQSQQQSASFSFTPAQGGGQFVFRQESAGPGATPNPANFIQNIFGQMSGGGSASASTGQPQLQNIFQNVLSMFNNPQPGAPPQPQAPSSQNQPAPSQPPSRPQPSAPSPSQPPSSQNALINPGPLSRVNQMLSLTGGGKFQLPEDYSARTETQQLGRYLEQLHFALSRLLPLTQRGAALLRGESRDANLSNRRDMQHIANSLGIIFSELGVGLLSVTHLFENLEVGGVPGSHRVHREAHECFRHIADNHQGPAHYQRARQILLTRVQQLNQMQPQPLQQPAPRSEEQKYEPEDLFDEGPGQATAPTPLLRAPQGQAAQNVQSPAQMLSSGQLSGANLMEMMQSRMNTPQGQMVQQMMGGFMPMFNEIMQNAQGANSIADIARNIQASRGVQEEIKEEDKDVLTKIMEVLEINDLMGALMGNFGSLLHTQPKVKKIIKSEMQKSRALDSEKSKSEQPDTPENRKYLASRMAKYLAGGLEVPESLKSHVKAGFDPIVASKQLIEDSSLKIIDFFMDFKADDHANPSQAFTEQFKNVLRQFVGRLVEELKVGFTGGTEDVIAVLRHNVSTQVGLETGEEENGMITSMLTNMLMRYVTVGYQQYMAQKETASIERQIQREEPKQAEEAKQPEEEKKQQSTSYSELETEEWKEVIARDEQRQKEMRAQRPFSNMYRGLNSMADLGSGIKTELMELGMAPTSIQQEMRLEMKEDILERRIRTTLENAGYPLPAIKKSMQERPVPVMLSKRYKELLKAQIKERAKEDSDFEEGRWENIDSLLKQK